MTREETKSCIGTIEMLQRLAYNIHGVMDVIDADNCKKIIKALEQVSTTKNDLGVREFEEIVVEYPPEDLCTYPEYKGKPYFSIKYKEGNDCFIGYGTYKPQVLSRYLKDYFMSTSVTPIRPKGHWIYDKSIANWRCSKCGETPKTIAYVGTGSFMAEHFKYCNHCGAKMEEVEE